MFQFREDLSPGSRHKPVPSSCHIHQLLSLKVAHDQRVEAVRAGKITADHELLSTIHAMLDPGAAAQGFPRARFLVRWKVYVLRMIV